MKLHTIFCASLVATTLAALPACALDWTVIEISPFNHFATDAPSHPLYPRVDQAPRGIKVYLGQGDIVPGDADRLVALYTSSEGGDSTISGSKREAYPEVWLHSPGGDAYEGMLIGHVIRNLQLATVVPEGAYCVSACATAFLGGVERRVEGPYLVHAASPGEDATDLYRVLDGLQLFAADYVNFVRLMIGDATVAEQALAFGGGGEKGDAFQLDDAQLRDWGVITVAARPTQNFPPGSLHTIDCAAGSSPKVTALMCQDLRLGRYDARLMAAMTKLEESGSAIMVLAQQARWREVRDECENKFAPIAALPARIDSVTGEIERFSEGDALSYMFERLLELDDGTGSYAVQGCLLEVYSARVLQLESLIAYRHATVAAALAGWE